MISLVALVAFPFAGRNLAQGDTFEASDRDATTLKLLKKAADVPAPRTYATKVLQPVQDSPEPSEPKSKRQYRRRDMTPEQP